MERKKFFLIALLILFLFKMPTQGAAQGKLKHNSKTQKNYFIKEDAKGTTLYQRLSWNNVEDIFGFEFILEKEEKNKNWVKIEKRTVKTNHIDLSLKPGKYRYKVSVINFLRQTEEGSEYRNFDVRIAYLPQITAVPKTISLDEFEGGIITVLGKNFHDETSFFIKHKEGRIVHGIIEEVDEKGKVAKVKFNANQIPLGESLFTAMDPSGLNDAKAIVFNFQKPLDIYLASGYAASIFAGDETFKHYFGTSSLLGGILRLSIVPIKKTYGNFGVNITFSGNTLKKKHENFILNGHFIFTHIDAAYIFTIIKKRLSLDIHVGGGYAFLTGVRFAYPGSTLKSPAYWYWGMTFNVGTALQVYMYKRLYAELNIDHTLSFRKGFPKYILQPSISMGWEF